MQEIDATFRRAMLAVEATPTVMAHAARDGVLEDFARCSEHLETVNQGVTSYLDLKRCAFPRCLLNTAIGFTHDCNICGGDLNARTPGCNPYMDTR